MLHMLVSDCQYPHSCTSKDLVCQRRACAFVAVPEELHLVSKAKASSAFAVADMLVSEIIASSSLRTFSRFGTGGVHSVLDILIVPVRSFPQSNASFLAINLLSLQR